MPVSIMILVVEIFNCLWWRCDWRYGGVCCINLFERNPFIQVPTSLLAQVDAAIGGKTGVNHNEGKNLIGAFYQPIKTIVDPTLLRSLGSDQMKEGLAEIIKYGVIMDKPLFWYIEQHVGAIKTFSCDECPDVWNFLIENQFKNKALVVSQDEREKPVS